MNVQIKKIIKYCLITIAASALLIFFFSLEKQEQSWLIAYSVFLYFGWACLKLWDERHAELKNGNRFRCQFYKEIYKAGAENEWDGSEARLEQRNIILPFPPYNNLSISDYLEKKEKTDENGMEYIDGVDFFSGKINSVRWNNSGRFFECEVEPFIMNERNNLGAVLLAHEQHGWNIAGLDFEAKKALKEWKASEEDKNTQLEPD